MHRRSSATGPLTSRPADPARRALLTGELLAPAEAPTPRLGPPPPWLAGIVSAAVCSDCAQPCVPACPEKIIRTHPADHPEAGLAWLDFETGPCTFCEACVEACPESPAARPARALPAVELDATSCLAAKGVVCVICVARCPERAIAGGLGGAISIDPDGCTGCGACLPACPVDALAIPADG